MRKPFRRVVFAVLCLSCLAFAAAPPRAAFVARRDTPIKGPGTTLSPGEAPPSNFAIADFNGDGRPDVAVLSAVTNSLVVMIDTGGGSFRAGPATNVGLVPAAIVAGDFNRDGKSDLAIVSLSGLGILLGNGDGTFQSLVNIRGGYGNALAAADFNHDGKLDLVVGYTQSDTLDLLLGNGDGTFQSIASVPAAANAVFLATADLNGDGLPDILAATGAQGEIATILNTGNGTFAAPILTSVPGATVLATGDFNGDGKVDVACGADVSGSNAVVLLPGAGDGTLGNPVTVVSEGTGGGPLVAAGDFNGDGNLDLAAVRLSLGSVATLVLPGHGDGTFGTPTAYPMAGPVALGVADFNGDRRPDILTANSFDSVCLLSVLLGAGGGAFQAAPQTTLSNFAGGSSAVGMAASDLNGDGLTDFVVVESKGVQVLLSAGDGTLAAGQFLKPASRANAMALADIDGDGRPDLILTGNSNNVSVFLGNGDGTFQSPLNSAAGAPQGAVAVGDLNRDGHPDLALIVGSSLAVMLGDGHGRFAAPIQAFAVGNEPVFITVADLNHDGKLDAVVANIGITTPPSSISLLLGNGDGTFQPQTNLPLPANAAPWDVEAADLNGDGNLDIVSSNNNESFLSIYLGRGDGTFRSPLKAPSAFAPENIVVQDFNGDGVPDIAVMSFGEEDAGMLIGKGDGTFEAPLFFGAVPSPALIAAGALTPGARPDLVLVNAAQYAILQNVTRGGF